MPRQTPPDYTAPGMIGIIDYGMGNLRSVAHALHRVHAPHRLVSSPSDLKRCSKLVLPGVGAFEDAIAALHRQQLVEPMLDAITRGTPFLGVCLGMQLLFDVGYENGQHAGLGVFAGKVLQLQIPTTGPRRLKVPHIGWNSIWWDRACPLLSGIPRGSFMYFLHSYYCEPLDHALVQTRSSYGHEFTSMVWRDNLFACQFHPEKSQAAGLRLYENFARLR